MTSTPTSSMGLSPAGCAETTPARDAKLFDLISPEDYSKWAVDRVIRGDPQPTKSPVLSNRDAAHPGRAFLFCCGPPRGSGLTNTVDGITYYRRNVPSGGNRHPMETYLSIHRVDKPECRSLPLPPDRPSAGA